MEGTSDSPQITEVVKIMKGFHDIIGLKSPEASNRRHSTYGKRLNFEDSLQQSSMTEKAKKRKLDADLAFSKTRIALLECELSNLKTSCKRDKIEYEANLEASKRAHEAEKEKREDIQQQVSYMKRQEKQILEELKSLRAAMQEQKLEHSLKMQTIMNEKLELESNFEELAQLKEKVFKLEAENERYLVDLDLCRNELKESHDECDRLLSRADMTQKDSLIEELQADKGKSERKIAELAQQLTRDEETLQVARLLQKDVASIRKLKSENDRLKEENRSLKTGEENTLLLKEQYEILHRAHEHAEQRCAALMQSHITNKVLREKLKAWESLKPLNAFEPHSSDTISKTISEFQQKEAQHLENIGDLTSNIHSLENAAKDLEKSLQTAKDEIGKKNSGFKQKENENKMLRKKLLLVSKERDFCREVNSQYENDLTVNRGLNMANADKMQHLESLLEQYKKHTENLEANLQKKDDEINQTVTKFHDVEENQNKALLNQLSEAGKKVEKLESEHAQLKSDNDALELRLEYRSLKGDYDPRNTKIIHLSANPLSEARNKYESDLRSLQMENDRLKQRVQLLEGRGPGPILEDVTAAVEQQIQNAPSGKEVKELQEKLANMELRSKKMMDIFKKTKQDLREAVYMLLGYQLDMPKHNQYRLSSMFAESQQDYLMFEQNSNGEIQLLETEFSKTLDSLISLHLHHQNSIPAFLCSVTMDLFSRQTILF